MEPGQPAAEQQLGRYALYDEIASGGMATVHFGRLRAEGGFQKTVAIKKLHEQYAKDEEFVAMFMDEARIAARIQHPNVVTTLDVGSVGGQLLLVMEYVDGETLSRLWKSQYAEGKRIPTDVAIGIVMGVLRGLHAAHQARDERGEPLSIIHRDISPHNILVGRDGVARVFDFGVAKVSGQLQSTRQGQVKGKLSYMPPEQVAGDELDCRADVFSTGVVLWEALTGERLRSGDDENAIYAQVVSGEVRRPSELVPDLPEGIDEVLLKALAKDCEDRYATADEFAEALEDVFGLVSPRLVGAWVEQCAADVLATRAAQRKGIESESSSDVRSRPADSFSGKMAAARASSPSSSSVSSVGAEDDPTRVEVARQRRRHALARRRRIVIFGAAFVVGGVAALLAHDWTGPSTSESTDGTDGSVLGVTPAGEPGEPMSSATAAESATSTEGVAGGAPAEPPTATAVARRDRPPVRPPQGPKPTASSGSTTTRPSDCDPPYIITKDGYRRYKVECM